MEKEQRNRLQKATQDARRLLEEEFAGQLLQTYDINVAAGRWNEEPGAHLQAEQRLIREKLVAWIEHRSAQINDEKEALLLTLREMAFTALNRFVALKLMEARELVRPCVSGGLESEGFQEFTAVAQGLLADQEGAYRLYLETIFEDVSRELRALFDPRDPASLLWPKRTALLELLEILNRPELAELWGEDETLGWVYQYFNGDAERKKMREESSAPRNSRELAVRNQFFTPRYVVEFLTDNTLGRIWYEMRQGDTGLKERCRYLVRRPNEIWLQSGEEPPAEIVADEALSQEELLRQPVHIPYRPLKDPREIRMLDPACGSMHFGLYAFDLYLAIYEEAWEIVQGSDEQAKQGEAFAAFITYAAGFADKAAFLREVPRLILLHNIHGVDIDPRATQIARLTLWLRAQRAWQGQGVEVAARPAVTRSNVVCAEPMPGERQLLADFVDQQFPEAERGLVQQLLEAIFDKMQLAGEAGSLLKIEEEIREAIDQARREWQKLAIQQRDLFSAAEMAELGGVGSLLSTELQNLTRDFWITVEERIYTALRDYAKQAESGSGLQRRLFAEDAAQGFAFIDVCRKRYDVALMNPPFGSFTVAMACLAKTVFGRLANDIYACFVRRMGDMLEEGGVAGIISSRSFITGKGMEALRPHLLGEGDTWLKLLWDLGVGVLDGAMVETAGYVYCSSSREPTASIGFWNDKHTEKATIKSPSASQFSSRSYSFFRSLPLQQLIYEADDEVRDGLSAACQFEPHLGRVTKGLSTCSNERFVRCLWEIPQPEIKSRWEFLSKGGEYRWLSCDLHLALNWGGVGRELAVFSEIANGNPARARQSSTYYFKPAVCFSGRSQKGFSARWMPAGCIFDTKSPVIVPKNISDLPWIPPILMSSEYQRLISLQSKFGSYDTSAIARLPLPQSTLEVFSASLLEIWFPHLKLERSTETTWYFLQPPTDPDLLRAQAFQSLCRIDELLKETGRSLDLEVRAYAEDSIKTHGCFSGLQSGFLSYCLGVAFGRWDIRYATSEQTAPELPDPFAPLPVCPPGQLQNAQGLPVRPEEVLETYPIRIPWDGILVDDPNHPRDLEHCVREVIEIIWSDQEGGPTADAIEYEACQILGVKTLRDYFRKPAGFFANHLSRYSKSRRQAPIYWQLSAGNGNYSAWLYYHRFTQDTLYRLLGDFVEIRIQEAEREQFELESQGGLSGEAASFLQEAQTLLQDLRLFKSELELVAPLWNPNLNDGVIINHSILWRITPCIPWQKKCKECWDMLVKGEYDWAHLAFHHWPERVIKKCQSDRSLAIAHGLEERLWQETNKGNWLQRQVSEAELQALIAEHSKPAVQNALERFLAAPPPVAAARTRAPRAAKSSSVGTTRKPRGSATDVDAEASRQTLLVLTAAPAEGLGRNAVADLLDVEAASLTAVIKQLKESGQLEQLGAARGAKYRLTEQGRSAVESQAGEDD
jgi:hypothetical protein